MSPKITLDSAPGQERLVYICDVAVEELSQQLRKQVGDARMVYAVHSAAGERLALVRDRKLAFVIARQNDMVPVTVH